MESTPSKIPRNSTEEELVDEVVASFTLDDAALCRVTDLLSAEMAKGLDPSTHALAEVKMFSTFVPGVPDGSEHGDFLAIDFGRSNFRIFWVHIPSPDYESEEVQVRSRIFVVAPPLKSGPGAKLFDFIVKCLANFMEKESLLGKKLPLCFTFSFPVEKDSLNHGRLLTWTKGFSCDGVEGEDVGRLFHEALARIAKENPGIAGVHCVAIVDDSTGTMIACAHQHPECRIGLVFGTSTNACYVEKAGLIGACKQAYTQNAEEMVVDVQWGTLGDNGCLDFLLTDFDKENDCRSTKPRTNTFEKLIAGHYLGEITRLALIKLHSLGILFKNTQASISAGPYFVQSVSPAISRSCSSSSLTSQVPSNKLDSDGVDFLDVNNRRSFHTKYLTEMKSMPGYLAVRQILGECGIENVSVYECEIVQRVCQAVSTRSAHLCSAALVAILRRVNRPQVTIAMDGSLYKFHSQFHDLITKKIEDLMSGGDCQTKLVLSEDGSGKGAGLVAAMARRVKGD